MYFDESDAPDYPHIVVPTLLDEIERESAHVQSEGRPFVFVDIDISKGTFLHDLKKLFPQILTLGTIASLSRVFRPGVDHADIAVRAVLPKRYYEIADFIACSIMTSGYFKYDDLAVLNMLHTLSVGGILDMELGFRYRRPLFSL